MEPSGVKSGGHASPLPSSETAMETEQSTLVDPTFPLPPLKSLPRQKRRVDKSLNAGQKLSKVSPDPVFPPSVLQDIVQWSTPLSTPCRE